MHEKYWLHRISVCDSIFKTIMINMYPELDTLKIHGSEYANILMTKLNNPFWRDVLKHFKKLYARCSPQNTDEFMAECLHHNPNIIREVVYLKNWLDSGIVFIRHIIDVDGKYMKFDNLKARFPHVHTNFLEYQGIVSAVKKYQEKNQCTIVCKNRTCRN